MARIVDNKRSSLGFVENLKVKKFARWFNSPDFSIATMKIIAVSTVNTASKYPKAPSSKVLTVNFFSLSTMMIAEINKKETPLGNLRKVSTKKTATMMKKRMPSKVRSLSSEISYKS